jgi:hypothetical protein
MVQEVNHDELANRLELCYKADQPLFIHGTTGIGKSDTVREVAEGIAESKGRTFVEWEDVEAETILNSPDEYFVFVDERLAQSDPSDVKGLPDLDGDSTEWKPPKWIDVVSHDDVAGFVFCDELNLAPQLVQAAYYEMILDKKVGDNRLSDEVYLVGAGNRTEDQAHIREMPAPLRNRFGHVELRPPSAGKDGSWTAWAIENDIDSRVLGFLTSNVGRTHLFEFTEDNRDAICFATPRTWEMASEAIQNADAQTPSEVAEVAAMFIGEGLSSKFKGFLETRDEVDVDAYLANPEKASELGDQQVDVKHALITAIAEEYKQDEEALDEVIEVAKYLDTEFGSFLLSMCRRYNEQHFQQNAAKNETFKELADEYVNYIL